MRDVNLNRKMDPDQRNKKESEMLKALAAAMKRKK